MFNHKLTQQFKDFSNYHPFLDISLLIDYFLIFGGLSNPIEIDIFDDLKSSIENFILKNHQTLRQQLSPSYILEPPYRDILIAIALSDGRSGSVFRRAKVGTNIGDAIVDRLLETGVIYKESSRQAPLRIHPKHLLKKSLRGYHIEYKLRFVRPIDRFWFGFVEPNINNHRALNSTTFVNNFRQHIDKANYQTFEQLSTLLVNKKISQTSHIKSTGSFWDHHSEFDILSITDDMQIILGECKYSSRAVSKKELNKLKEKAKISNIQASKYALFAKNGFSKELLNSKDDDILLFDINSFSDLL